MRCAFILGAFVILFALAPAVARDSEPDPVRYTAAFSTSDLTFGKLLQYDTVVLMDSNPFGEPGRPMLPALDIRIALPAGMRATAVRVENTAAVALAGEYTIFPFQPPRRISGGRDAGFVAPDASVYGSTLPYPAQTAELTGQTDLAGQGIAMVRLYPVQYVPALKTLALYTSMTIVVEGVGGYVCGDYLTDNIDAAQRDAYARMVGEMVVNPQDVALQSIGTPPKSRGVSSGDYDYVIITQDSWVDDFQPLADWKKQKGVPANIVTTAWIYNSGGYSGDNQTKIRAFVQDARNTWGAVYFLLGGDTDTVPYHTKNVDGDNIPNDTYYGDYDADWTCEVHVGRAAVRNTGQIATFIDKVLTYEQNPPLTNYAKYAGLFGFDLYTWGSEEGEGCKEAIDSLYIPSGWTLRKEYDSQSGTHKTDVISYLNQGNNLANHIDHSDWDCMGVGYTNHGQMLDVGDVNALTNGDRQTIFYSIGCWPCAYDYTTCIAEAFVQNSGGGGVAFVGNSRYGWYSPYDDDYYSLRYDRYFFRSLFSQNYYKLGECFSDHKNDAYGSDTKYIFTELTLLGDPELNIWTENPGSLSVTYDNSIDTGSQSYTVNVKSGGSNVTGATVCLWKGTQVYAVALTNSSGNASFNINPTDSGTMLVTAAYRNKLPFMGTCTVSGGGASPVPDIKVNGSDGPLTVDADDLVMAAISLDPGSLDGDPADWWVYVQKDTNTWWRKYTAGWKKSAAPIRFTGADLQAVNNYVVLDLRTLPAGTYMWTFSVDEKNDFKEDTYTDSVDLTVVY